MKFTTRIAIILAIGFSLSVSHGGQTSTSVFPDDCWGVYGWASWNSNNVSRKSHPLIKGGPMILKWRDIEPEEGVFKFEELVGQKLQLAEENEFYTFLMIWVAPGAPRWLYENEVPELEMTPTIGPLGQARDWTFQYYLDEDYIRFYHRLMTRFGEFVKGLPKGQRDRILYIQSAEGSTGDGWGYKGKPLDLKYDISDKQWGEFRIQAWEILKLALTDEDGEMVVPLLVNYDSNQEEQYRWVLDNLPAIGLKNGMFSHGYHISDTKQRIRNWNAFTADVRAHGKEFFSRGEQDAEYRTYGWSTQNIAQGLYWSAIFATHCGLDMWNVPWEASEGYTHAEALRFFNRYAGHHEAAEAPAAFCALRKGLDAADTDAYPESIHGKAEKRNIPRYLSIAEAYKAYGAIQGNPEKAIGGGMLNRKRQDYNDVGWGIHDGNYERFLSQIDPEETSLGWWHRGPKESLYSRFARSTDVRNGSNALYFDLDDGFLEKPQPVELRVVWLDEGNARWELHYNSSENPQQAALTIEIGNTGKWKETTVVLDDFRPENLGPRGSDLSFTCDGSGELVLHLVEVTKI